MNLTGRAALLTFTAALAAVAMLSACSSPGKKARHINLNTLRQCDLLDADWLFHRGDVTDSNAVAAAEFDDSQWRPVHLPHDYGLDATYNPTNTRSQGYLPFTVAWYRKHLSIPASDSGKVLRLDFDGVFRNSQVWLNGTCLGKHLSGYTPFSYDITKLAKLGADNVITVRVDPTAFEGWWYEGSGIYRHVHLTALAPVHVAQYGTYIVSTVPNGDQGADDDAEVAITTTIENSGDSTNACDERSDIIAPDGSTLELTNTAFTVSPNSHSDVVQHAVISHPQLWSLQSPNLYTLRTTILRDGRPVDSTTTTFGVRTIRYDADQGFFLNGRHVEIQGLCNHQDLSALGIAVPDNLQAWRVAQLKQAGCNAWRTAHNPPSEALLDACDRLGMLVMDENRHFGDTYAHHSAKGTTATNLSDLATMIQRDRNHPSIVMWSMCNEEPLQGSPEGAAIFRAMMQVVHQYDITRPITSAMVGGFLTASNDADVEDIVGVNYNVEKYDAIHARQPHKAMFGSEDTNQKTTRGEYADDKTNGMCSAYNLSVKDWLQVVNRPFMCGSFTWTGFDYRGEPNPFGWPDISNNTGLLDLCGFPKDKFYYFQSCWTDKPMVHLVPDNWNSPGQTGQNIRVIAFSNAKQVELILNGRSLGVKDLAHDDFAEWQVPYEPGQLTARALDHGSVMASEQLATTGPVARIRFEPLPQTDILDGPEPLTANGEDAAVLQVSLVDEQGRVVPDADNEVTFQLSGSGRIAGTGNGNPADHSGDRTNVKKAFHGHCVVFVQAGTDAGMLQVTATVAGLAPASADVTVK